jgi:hypothetical protein
LRVEEEEEASGSQAVVLVFQEIQLAEPEV